MNTLTTSNGIISNIIEDANADDFLSNMLDEIAGDHDALELLEDLATLPLTAPLATADTARRSPIHVTSTSSININVQQPIHVPSSAVATAKVEDKCEPAESSTKSNMTSKVDHSYVDYSRGGDCSLETATISRGSKKGVFPTKLMNILSHHELTHIVGWCPHGRAFIVRDATQFERMVLPRFFKTSQMKSFRKQLSLWGFKRITKGPDAGSYYHQFFLRGTPDLLKMMKYQKIKGTGRASTPNPDDEPNFYELAKRNPLPEISVQYQRQPYHRSPVVPRVPVTRYQPSAYTQHFEPAYVSSHTPTDSYVTDDDDTSFSSEEVMSIYSQMSFPGPFTPPPEIILSKS